MSKHQKLFSVAYNQAEMSTRKFAHGSAICKSGKPLVLDYNNDRSTYKGKLSPCIHSEMAVIIKWLKIYCKDCKNLDDIKKKGKKYCLYVTRKDFSKSNNIFANSKPCYSCSILIKKCNFRKIIYTTGDDQVIKIIKPKDIDLSSAVLTSSDQMLKGKIDIRRSIINII